MSGFDPGLRSSLFLTEKLSITGQKCLKNGSNFLRREICFTGPVPDRFCPLQISELSIILLIISNLTFLTTPSQICRA